MRSLLRAGTIALATSLIFAGMAGGAAAAAAAPAKIGYINSALLLQQAPGRAEAEAQFDKRSRRLSPADSADGRLAAHADGSVRPRLAQAG